MQSVPDFLDALYAEESAPQLKLARARAARDKFIPREFTNIMDRAIEDLAASGIQKSALKNGGQAPAFSLPDTEDCLHSLEEYLTKGPLVISFNRGRWCPYCNIELRGLEKALPDIERRGASLIAISPELPERQTEMRSSCGTTFPLLHDAGNAVARRFGIVYELPQDLLEVYKKSRHELAVVSGPKAATELPLPAMFVVGREGDIRYAFVDADYTKRALLEDILAAL